MYAAVGSRACYCRVNKIQETYIPLDQRYPQTHKRTLKESLNPLCHCNTHFLVSIIMRPSSLGGAAYCVALCLSVCLSVRLSVRPSRYCCQRHVAPPSELQ